MRTKLILLILTLFTGFSFWGQVPFQVTKGSQVEHLHDLNIEPIPDGSNDFLVAGNLFDAGMNMHEIFLMRVTNTGIIVWFNKYSDMELENARCFDIVIKDEEPIVAMTGSIDIFTGQNYHKAFIAEFDYNTGMFIKGNLYDIFLSTYHSRGLHIISSSQTGYVVAGFVSDVYNLSTQASNMGFILHVDPLLNTVWCNTVDDVIVNPPDFDMANHVVETNSGYFLTGACTGFVSGMNDQSVLATKFAFNGTPLWNASYARNTVGELGVDAYFDPGGNQIYTLCNYEDTKYFGVTAIDDTTGVINLPQSWVGFNSDDDEKYGFTLDEIAFPNLLISGYDKYETWVDNVGNNQTGVSNLINYEFDALSTNSFPPHYQYLVPHSEPGSDEFNFWQTNPMPLIYYPDIMCVKSDFFHAGYRTRPTHTLTETELIKTQPNKINACENRQFLPSTFPFEAQLMIEDLIPEPVDAPEMPLQIVQADVPPTTYTCDPNADVSEMELNKIHIYPNPANESIVIEPSNIFYFSKNIIVIIYNNLGERLANYNINKVVNKITLDVSQLPSGVYMLQLSNGKYTKNAKLLIE